LGHREQRVRFKYPLFKVLGAPPTLVSILRPSSYPIINQDDDTVDEQVNGTIDEQDDSDTDEPKAKRCYVNNDSANADAFAVDVTCLEESANKVQSEPSLFRGLPPVHTPSVRKVY
jgi:hypothetical protein